MFSELIALSDTPCYTPFMPKISVRLDDETHVLLTAMMKYDNMTVSALLRKALAFYTVQETVGMTGSLAWLRLQREESYPCPTETSKEHVQVLVYLNKSTQARLKWLSRRNKTTMSAIVGTLVEEEYKNPRGGTQ